MKLGSLFDGSGTAPLAASMCGIWPVWASEIEPYPIKVTTARFKRMMHLGSITDIDGTKVTPVDIICGGSPCQDLSVAGKQAGLHNGERSHLFFEMTRIIKEMRSATDGKYPRFVIWENVPGAFSSNKGRDFLAVLQAFAEIADPDIHVPEPKQKASGAGLAWKYAGYVAGDGWSIAWRTVDAQYWGVPQRRRRIYLVADFAGERADEILFERTGVSGNPEQSGTTREETAGDAGSSLEGSSGVRCLNPWDSQMIRQYDADGVYPTLTSNATGGQNRQGICISAEFVGRQGAQSGSVGFEVETAPTLRQAITVDTVYAVEGNTVDRNSNKNGSGVCSDVSPTLNTQDRHGVAYTADCRNLMLNHELSGTLQAKNQGGHSLNYINPVVYPGVGITSKQNGSNPQPNDPCPTLTIDSRRYCVSELYEAYGFGKFRPGIGTLRASGGDCGNGSEMLCAEAYPDITGPLCANSHPGSYTGQDAFNDMLPVVPSDKPPRKYIIRRITPLECCRLQGFPDWWEDGVEGSDAARYKMWGNGMALPNMLFVMRRIAETVRGETL